MGGNTVQRQHPEGLAEHVNVLIHINTLILHVLTGKGNTKLELQRNTRLKVTS